MEESTITIADTHTSCVGPDAVEIFRLTSLCSALRLELKGIRLSRHTSALAVAKHTDGMRTNNRLAHIAKIELMIEDLRKRVVVVDARGALAALVSAAGGH